VTCGGAEDHGAATSGRSSDAGGRTNWRREQQIDPAAGDLRLPLSPLSLSCVWVSPAKGGQVNSEREISCAPSPCLWCVGKQGSRLQPISRPQTIPLPRTPKWRPPSSPRRHSDTLPASPTPRRPKSDAISATGQARWTPSIFQCCDALKTKLFR
jgi:hypothetical protein